MQIAAVGGGTLPGTYGVVVDFKPGQTLGGDTWPLERTRVEAIAADIDEALRAWPTANSEEL
jgi:hypothetical protein